MADIVKRVRRRIESGSKDPLALAARTPAPAATYASIAADEQTLCFQLPPLLKRLYVELGNGGWGPGYGLLGLTGGAKDDLGRTAVQSYVSHRERMFPDDPSWHWPTGLLPICHWGCGIYSCIDCGQPNFPVIAFDPNGHDAHNDWTDAFFPECERFDKWIELWADGHDLWERLYSDDGVIATAHYQRSVSQFTQLAADDFRRSAATEQEQRAAICRYFRRGEVDYSVAELIDFLGVSTPSVLSMAGYSDEGAQRVMEMLADITEEEIQDTAL